MKHFFGKTVMGAVVAGLGVLAHPAVFALLPGKVAAAVVVGGAILNQIGKRDAIAKNGNGL